MQKWLKIISSQLLLLMICPKLFIKYYLIKKFKNLQICHISSKEKVSRTKLAKLVIKNSKKGFKMKFKKTLFKFINYSEPRGRKK